MKKVLVQLPVTAIAVVEIEVDDDSSETVIFEVARAKADIDEHVEDYEFHRTISLGNHFSGLLNAWKYEVIED